MGQSESTPPTISLKRDTQGVVMEISGLWRKGGPAPEVMGEGDGEMPKRYETESLEGFDSTLPAFLLSHLRKDEQKEPPSLEGMPDDLRGLMQLALEIPERSDARTVDEKAGFLAKTGKGTLAVWRNIRSLTEFIGTSVLSLGRFVTGHARFRFRDFWVVVQQCGVEALPIVSLISFLIGMILAFVGNVQLANFGASIFVADLVGIAMVREMGVVMTSIIMSGRTGAAFAANIGSMKANEEIDALKTFGFDPFDFLVLPRMLALVIMMPLLTIYSNLMGILGGMLVGAMADIPPVLYWHQTVGAISLTTASLGVLKSFVFGAAIAISGCYQGMQSGNSSAAVGEATTRAVVASITAVIVLDSAFAAIFTVLNI